MLLPHRGYGFFTRFHPFSPLFTHFVLITYAAPILRAVALYSHSTTLSVQHNTKTWTTLNKGPFCMLSMTVSLHFLSGSLRLLHSSSHPTIPKLFPFSHMLTPKHLAQ